MASSIKTQLSEIMKSSLKAGDKDTLSFARNLHGMIRKKEIDTRVDLDDAEVLKVIASALKQRQESITQFKQGNREDLVAREEAEMKFLQKFMPPQMSEDELLKLVKETIVEVSANSSKDMGKVMKALLPKVQGRADGKLMSQLVQKALSS